MKRSKHNLSHYQLTTFDQGNLIPVACVEVLPGDTFRHSTSAMIRAAAQVNPVMHPCELKIHHWYVPNSIIWDDWEKFISKKDNTVNLPTIDLQGGHETDLLDHLGVPPDAVGEINALPIRAYNKIFNENYRDQDLQNHVNEESLYLQQVCWAKDRFTTARTEAQMGDAIPIPFAPQELDVETTAPAQSNLSIKNASGDQAYLGVDQVHAYVSSSTAPNDSQKMFVNMASGGIDINDYRRALAMQRLLEHRSRFGSRYTDYLRSLGIRPSDGRLQEPEYLGGGKQSISWSEVLATAEGANTAVGDMSGHGIASIRTRPYTRFFEEAGWVLTLAYVRPKTIYMRGLNRHWLRSDADDFWQKEYEAFGPQEVFRNELYAAHPVPRDVLGYNDRHAEYRRQESYVTGDFRNTTSDSWHLARNFTAAPTLNNAFIECNPTDRIYADTSIPEIYGMFNHRIAARRLVSKRSRY